ncbi:MAG: EAL domain-containing protein, partial [Chromatiales bacterium]|nr:EAL domain-containing protein [Chromatiales bacterium]
IWLQDTGGRLLFVNKAFCDAVGVPEGNFLKVAHYAELYPEETAKSCMASDQKALEEDGPHHSYEKMKFVDGELHDLEILKVRLVDNDGAVSGLIGLSTDITQRNIDEENLRFLAHHDGLTGLYNRNYFVDQLRKAFSIAQRQNNHGALFFFDCDHFKSINDSLGHQIGDEILKEMGTRLSQNVRKEDDVARLGGDEFVVMAVNIGEDERVAAERAQSLAEKLKDALLEPYEVAGQLHHLTPSVGVSLFPQEEQTADDVLKHADTAMYRAKDAGRNAIRFFMPSMQQEVEQRLRTQTELRHAITHDELELHFQPQINATTGVTGVEALIRWNHPEHGLVFPDYFIEIAEESSLIIPMGEWVLENGLMQLRKWQAEGLVLGTLAINVSPKQFHQDSFVEYVKGLLNKMEMSGDVLELELTENILLDQTAETVSKIEALKEVGVLFSIDDFGTGYSSMAYLKKLPLDRLKIDKSFVSDITTDINDAHIVKTIIGMSHNLGLELIAEGVETREEMEFLLENGCDNFQGYYFARPMPAGKVIEFCESHRPVLLEV